MIHFKLPKHNLGFTLPEVMMTLILVAVIIPSLLNLFNSLYQQVNKYSHNLDHILLAKQFLLHPTTAQGAWAKRTLGQVPSAEPETNEIVEKKIEYPESTMRYEIIPLAEKSSLAGVAGLKRQQVTIAWTDVAGKRQETLVSFIFVPTKKDKNEK